MEIVIQDLPGSLEIVVRCCCRGFRSVEIATRSFPLQSWNDLTALCVVLASFEHQNQSTANPYCV